MPDVNRTVTRVINDHNIQIFNSLLAGINWVDVYVQNTDDGKFSKFIDLYMWAVNKAFLLINAKVKKSVNQN